MRIDWNAIPFMPGMRAGSERQGICGDKLSAVRVVTAPEAQFDGKTHWHDNEQLLVMLSGMVRLVVDGRELEAPSGRSRVLSGRIAACGDRRRARGGRLLRDFRARAPRPAARLGRQVRAPFRLMLCGAGQRRPRQRPHDPGEAMSNLA